jgi:predicted outer membrane repeat protein
MTIRSTTGLTLAPAGGFSESLMRLEDKTTWTYSSINSFPCSDLISSTCYSSSSDNGDNKFQKVTIEGLTFRDSEDSAIDGMAFATDGEEKPELHINNSRFVSNSTPIDGFSNGGAIETYAELFVSNSIFIDNYSHEDGGAIWSQGDVWIDQSLFMQNSADDNGGAVRSEASTYASNSTFLDSIAGYVNSSGQGGAILSTGRIDLVLNTFDNNFDSETEYSSSSAYSPNGDIRIWGNIFANNPDDLDPSVFSSRVYDFGYNIFTGTPGDFLDESSSIETRPNLAFDDLDETEVTALMELKTPVTFAPVLGLGSSSVAAGFVKQAFPTGGKTFEGDQYSTSLSGFFDDKISVDQLGTSRTLPFAAGAHQASARRSSGGTAPVAIAPVVPKEAMVPGFAANSTKLTKPMKKQIRQFLKANPNLKNVVCKGYTSSPSTPQDRTLARKRGKATCDYILTLRPDAQVTIRSGSHTNKPGSQIRRVEIKLS